MDTTLKPTTVNHIALVHVVQSITSGLVLIAIITVAALTMSWTEPGILSDIFGTILLGSPATLVLLSPLLLLYVYILRKITNDSVKKIARKYTVSTIGTIGLRSAAYWILMTIGLTIISYAIGATLLFPSASSAYENYGLFVTFNAIILLMLLGIPVSGILFFIFTGTALPKHIHLATATELNRAKSPQSLALQPTSTNEIRQIVFGLIAGPIFATFLYLVAGVFMKMLSLALGTLFFILGLCAPVALFFFLRKSSYRIFAIVFAIIFAVFVVGTFLVIH